VGGRCIAARRLAQARSNSVDFTQNFPCIKASRSPAGRQRWRQWWARRETASANSQWPEAGSRHHFHFCRRRRRLPNYCHHGAGRSRAFVEGSGKRRAIGQPRLMEPRSEYECRCAL